MKICVFCSSSNAISQSYQDFAHAFASKLVHRQHQMVYGGASVGLMGIVARRVLELGAHVIGIIPDSLSDKEIALNDVSELIVTSDLRERKKLMGEASDAFIVLPGGFGTLDEAFEELTLRQLGYHSKPIVFLNHNHFWDPIKAWLQTTVRDNIISQRNADLAIFCDEIEDAFEALENYS